jgi:flagellar hook-length control protein FliK
MINDAQLARENFMKVDGAQSDDLGQKVARIDTGANDSNMLGSQNQTAEKAFESTGFTKPTEAGHESLRTQTFDQIVKRAVIHTQSGQQEARIDLKPDFLGHVRMQVTTENHQVTVKILTEFSAVKDMIENNIQQLKSDLQQQGLSVDKLEVSVSSDSDKYQDTRREAARPKNRLRRVGLNNLNTPEDETGPLTANSASRKAGESTVDYFA